jgi:hypothetical protein
MVNINYNMIKKTNLLALFFLILRFSFPGEENYKKSNFNLLLNYTNFLTNGLTALGGGLFSLKLLKKNNFHVLKRFPHVEFSAYAISVFLPFFVSGLRAKKFFNKLSYDYIIKNFDSVKRHDYWFDKSVMIDDLKMNLLEKSEFEKDSDSYQKYKILLDILTKSPKKIIDELKNYNEQKNFLSAVLLLDAEKVGHLRFENQTNIKEAFKETSALNKKISDSLFFNTSQIINYFLNKVNPPIAAKFIVQYKDDIKNFIDSFISLGLEKKQNILSAKEKEKTWIISDSIVLDIILEIFDKSNEAAYSLLENLSDENFWSLINYVFFSKDQSSFKDKLNTFSDLIKYFYQQNKENFSDKNNPFAKKTNFLMQKNEKNKTKIVGWWLSVAEFKKEQFQQKAKSMVNLPEQLLSEKTNNTDAIFPLNNNLAAGRDSGYY